MKLIPIVLSGGSGTRLWPISRASFPKQFCHLLDETLQTLTFKRLERYEPALLITSEKLKVLTEKEIKDHSFKIQNILYESQGKSTGPAVAVACKYLELNGFQNEVCGVFSSDALIADENEFHNVVEKAVLEAKVGKIVILGIQPNRVETGFGYIQIPTDSKLGQPIEVLKFHEKPSYETAKKFLADGDFYWNAGIFIFQISKMIQFFKMYQPEMWAIVSELKSDLTNLDEIYMAVKSISLDVAIIEKLQATDLSCIPCDIGWSDVGSWDVLDQINSQRDEKLALSKKPFEVEAAGNAVFSDLKKVYSFVGVSDLLLVDTADAVLISAKEQTQKVKDVVELVKTQNLEVTKNHRFDVRPWGNFEVIKDDLDFKTKLITVDAGQKISYQSHKNRSEHWIVINGSATVIIDGIEHKRTAGEHILIPQCAKHRIINNSNERLQFIEVQVGTYFGEDDITRYEDDYGRS